jgi:hypothetical protein
MKLKELLENTWQTSKNTPKQNSDIAIKYMNMGKETLIQGFYRHGKFWKRKFVGSKWEEIPKITGWKYI